jgi:phosphoribosylglycinamide formyltransferase 1
MSNIAIFASGSGSNAENIITYFNRRNTGKVVLVLSENKNAFVFERARKLDVPSIYFTFDELKNGTVLSILKQYHVDIVVLAGFLKLFPASIIEEYPNRIVNIHPALLPKFGGKGMFGLRVHQAVIDAGERESGITVHFVNNNYDEGDIIFQAKCPVLKEDNAESLAQRVHELEYMHFPKVIEGLILKGK